jgi:hypothetical protein
MRAKGRIGARGEVWWRWRGVLLALFLLGAAGGPAHEAWAGAAETQETRRSGAPVDPSSLDHKFILGYQGWFACPTDPGMNGHWSHWFAETSQGLEPSFDLLPDVSELSPAERCATPLHDRAGRPVYVFSAQNPQTVDRHFAWMAEYGIEGVALQRFAVAVRDAAVRAHVEQVRRNVTRAAEAHGRIFFIMYDLSGLKDEELGVVLKDWAELEADGATASPAYAHHRGHPVLALWGVGFHDRPLRPATLLSLFAALRRVSAAHGGVTLMGGVPWGWRADIENPETTLDWEHVFRALDIISPWAVGAYGDDAGADQFLHRQIIPDLALTRALGLDYMPVVFPGFSWKNLMNVYHSPNPHPLNAIPRRCGRFFWHQVANVVGAGATMMYGAMFDEVDEGTALFKVTPHDTGTPPGFLALDADGCDLPADWYLRLAGLASSLLAGQLRFTATLPLTPP